MGKSNKKNKADKINALRKRYDAFLEEDKKRKERNDFILGRLEKMRSCTNLIQLRSRGYPKDGSDYHSDISNTAIAVPRPAYLTPKYDDEPSILREISQKYILIPKILSNAINNVNYSSDRTIQSNHGPDISSDTDWKSKYSILDELKLEQKVRKPNETYVKRDHSYDNIINSGDVPEENKEFLSAANINISKLASSKPESDKFLKDMQYNKQDTNYNDDKEKESVKPLSGKNIEAVSVINVEKEKLVLDSNKQEHEVHDQKAQLSLSLPEKIEMENEVKQNVQLISNCNYEPGNKESNNLLHDKSITQANQPKEALESNKYLPEEKNTFEFDNKSQQGVLHSALNVENNSLLSVNHENANLESKDEIVLSHEEIENSEVLLHNDNRVEAQVAYREVVAAEKEEPATNIKQPQEYEQQHKPDLNPVQNIEQNANTEVNDEFEVEQKEMFYPDETNNEYNQNVETTLYTQENENYTDEQYAYYNESEKEQIYPIEINEHEEATERYDQNYEQQYVNNYEDTLNAQYQPQQYSVDDQQQMMYEQQEDVNYQQQQNQNYEYENNKDANPTVNYDNVTEDNEKYDATDEAAQPALDYTAQDYDVQQEYIMEAQPEAIENIEQQLDLEDVSKSNILIENQNYEEVVNELPSNKQSDVNVT